MNTLEQLVYNGLFFFQFIAKAIKVQVFVLLSRNKCENNFAIDHIHQNVVIALSKWNCSGKNLPKFDSVPFKIRTAQSPKCHVFD